MIRKSDLQWWLQEARKDPASAAAIIEELAGRLEELDRENEQLRDELVRLQTANSAGPVPASEELNALQAKVSTLQTILEGQASTEAAVVLISNQLQAARLPLSQVRLRLRDGRPALDRSAAMSLRCMLLARPQNDLLLLTSQGRAIRLMLHKVPFLVEQGDWPAVEGDQLATGERVTAAAVLGAPPRFWTVVTRQGYARQFLHAHLERLVESGAPLVGSPHRNDEPVALVDGDRGALLLVTRWGKAVCFPQRTLTGPGVEAMAVEADDQVAAALPLPSDGDILLLTAAGFALRRDSTQIKAQVKPGGAGKGLIRAFDLLDAVTLPARGKLLYLTFGGKFVAADAAAIPAHNRFGKGAPVLDLSHDPAVAVALVPGSLL